MLSKKLPKFVYNRTIELGILKPRSVFHSPWSLAVSQTVSQNRAFDLFTDSAKILIRLKVRTEMVPIMRESNPQLTITNGLLYHLTNPARIAWIA